MSCYICQPHNPNAAEEGCADCEREFWHAYLVQLATARTKEAGA